jgi:hypothetical protein
VLANFTAVVPIERYRERVIKAVDLAKRYVASEAAGLRWLDASPPEHWVVFTEARFDREYYYNRFGKLAIVSLGYWRTEMAPPSALEFIVRMAQTSCAHFFTALRTHYFTRGCLFDYNERIKDAKLMVLHGNLCAFCRQRAIDHGQQTQLEALDKLTGENWIGDTTKIDSVASILKKVYNYDLYVSRGLSPTRLEALWDNVSSSSVQEFIKLIAAVVLAYLLLKFGLKAGG